MKGRSSKFKKRTTKHDYHSLSFLVEQAWGVKSGRMYLCRLRKELATDGRSRGVDVATSNVCVSFGEEVEDKDVRTVIDDYDLAEKVFSAKYLFVVNKIRQQAADLEPIDRVTYHLRKRFARQQFDESSAEVKEEWEQERRKQLREWGGIKDTLMRELQNNNSITYEKLASKIDYWCGEGTIRKWVQSRDGYKVYMERVIPLLSKAQRQKHLDCAKMIRSNWGLGAGKYLWIHYDEKWF